MENIEKIRMQIKNACIDGNIDLFKELINKYNYKKPYNYIYLLDYVSSENTDKHIYEWVLNSSCFQIKGLNVIQIVSKYIYLMDKINAHELLYNILKKQKKQNHPNIISILFLNACNNNHFDIAKNIIIDFKDNNNNKDYSRLEKILYNSCANICEYIAIYGDILFCEWLFTTIPELNSNKQAIYNGFKNSILHSDFEMAKLFHKLLGDYEFEKFVKINNYLEYNNLFERIVCYNYNIEFAKWLYSLKKEIWFHHINYIKIFELTCIIYNNRGIYNKNTTREMINICNWLIYLDPNIVLKIQDDIFNIYTRKLQYIRLNEEKECFIMVLDWFVSLKPYHYFFDTNETKYKIRSPKDAKWEERKIYHYLLLHPEIIVKEKNQITNAVSVLHNLPADISRYIISFI